MVTVYTFFCLFIFYFLLYFYSTSTNALLESALMLPSLLLKVVRHTLVVAQISSYLNLFFFFLNLFFKIFFINKKINKREIMTQNNNFMSLYGFAFVIFGLRRNSFDITSHTKTTKNTCCFCLKKTLRIELLYNCYHLLEFALIETFKL